jgi:hypothetical protein
VIERFVGRSPRVMVDAIEAHLGWRLPDGLESYEHVYATAFEAELTSVDGVEEAIPQVSSSAAADAVDGRSGSAPGAAASFQA